MKSSKPVKVGALQRWLNQLQSIVNKRTLDASDEVVAIVPTSTSTQSTDLQVPVGRERKWSGIKNMGATCYINAIMQLWFHVRGFRDLILETPLSDRTDGAAVDFDQILFGVDDDEFSGSGTEEVTKIKLRHGLKKVMLELEYSIANNIDISHLVRLLKIDPSVHQDALEFYRLLSTFIPFETCQTSYNTHCFGCDRIFDRMQSFTQLDLTIANVVPEEGTRSITLEQCLARHFGHENLDEKYNCDNCGPSDAERFVKVHSFPKILCLHILRFVYEMASGTWEKKKLMTTLEFPLTIDLSNYGGAKRYDLVAALIHHGTINHGHYISNMKCGTMNEWFQFDDENVRKLDLSSARNLFDLSAAGKVKKIAFDSKDPHQLSIFSSKNVYMLTYVQNDGPLPDPVPAAPFKSGKKRLRQNIIVIDGDDESKKQVPVDQPRDPAKLDTVCRSIYDSINSLNTAIVEQRKEKKLEQESTKSSQQKAIEMRRQLLRCIDKTVSNSSPPPETDSPTVLTIDIDDIIDATGDSDWIFIGLEDLTQFFKSYDLIFDYQRGKYECQHGNIFDTSPCILLPSALLADCSLEFTQTPFRRADQCHLCAADASEFMENKTKHSEHVETYKNIVASVKMESPEFNGVEMGYISKRWLIEWCKKRPNFAAQLEVHALPDHEVETHAKRFRMINVDNDEIRMWKLIPTDYPFNFDYACIHGKTPLATGMLRQQPMQALNYLISLYPEYVPLSMAAAQNCEECEQAMTLNSSFSNFKGNTRSGISVRYLHPRDTPVDQLWIIPCQREPGEGKLICEHGHLQVDVFEHLYVNLRDAVPGFMFLTEADLDKLEKADFDRATCIKLADARRLAVCKECLYKRRWNPVLNASSDEILITVQQSNAKRKRPFEIYVPSADSLADIKLEIGKNLNCFTVDFDLYWMNGAEPLDESKWQSITPDSPYKNLFFAGVLVDARRLDHTMTEDDIIEIDDDDRAGFKGTLLVQQ